MGWPAVSILYCKPVLRSVCFPVLEFRPRSRRLATSGPRVRLTTACDRTTVSGKNMRPTQGSEPAAKRAICGASAVCVLVGIAAILCVAQQKPAAKEATLSGLRLYKSNCAVCHGNDGKGNGPPPASSPFTEPPPDLTTLAKRHDGKFPDAYVELVLRNGTPAPNHGPAEMPVWGMIFKATSKAGEAQVSLRIKNLADYLKSIQAK